MQNLTIYRHKKTRHPAEKQSAVIYLFNFSHFNLHTVPQSKQQLAGLINFHALYVCVKAKQFTEKIAEYTGEIVMLLSIIKNNSGTPGSLQRFQSNEKRLRTIPAAFVFYYSFAVTNSKYRPFLLISESCVPCSVT